MPKAYSIDLRRKVLEANENHEGTNDELAERFKISISTVKRIKQRFQATGSIEIYINRCGRKAKLDEQAYLALKDIVSATPDLTLKEIADLLYKNTKISLKKSAIHNALKNLNLRYKKKSVYAIQRDKEDVKKKRRVS
jgi:transposase